MGQQLLTVGVILPAIRVLLAGLLILGLNLPQIVYLVRLVLPRVSDLRHVTNVWQVI